MSHDPTDYDLPSDSNSLDSYCKPKPPRSPATHTHTSINYAAPALTPQLLPLNETLLTHNPPTHTHTPTPPTRSPTKTCWGACGWVWWVGWGWQCVGCSCGAVAVVELDVVGMVLALRGFMGVVPSTLPEDQHPTGHIYKPQYPPHPQPFAPSCPSTNLAIPPSNQPLQQVFAMPTARRPCPTTACAQPCTTFYLALPCPCTAVYYLALVPCTIVYYLVPCTTLCFAQLLYSLLYCVTCTTLYCTTGLPCTTLYRACTLHYVHFLVPCITVHYLTPPCFLHCCVLPGGMRFPLFLECFFPPTPTPFCFWEHKQGKPSLQIDNARVATSPY